MWCIWNERNNRCFEDSERAMPDIKLLFFRTLLEWFSMWRNHSFSLLDLLDFCNFRFLFVFPCILPVCLGVSFLSMKTFYLSKKKKKIECVSHLLKLCNNSNLLTHKTHGLAHRYSLKNIDFQLL